MTGLKPQEIWDMELWEYNAFVTVHEDKQKQNTVNAIMTGYYCAYYINGGKKTQKPQDLINKLFNKKQNFEDGMKDIERIKRLEQRGDVS